MGSVPLRLRRGLSAVFNHLEKFGSAFEYAATMYVSRKNPACESNDSALTSTKSRHLLVVVFFLLGTCGPIIFAANLSSNRRHLPLAIYIIAEVVVLGLALFFELRGPARGEASDGFS
jgi:hypothetical protein